MEKSDIIFQLNHITQEFPGVKALDDVSFSVRRGRIHALVGENGAGKSTLIKVIKVNWWIGRECVKKPEKCFRVCMWN